MNAPMHVPAPPDASPSSSRHRWLAFTSLVVLAGALVFAAWWIVLGQHTVTTDNAYVAGDLVQVTSQVSGTVVAITLDDMAHAVVGVPLVRLDATDAQVALEGAQARLAQVVRTVSALYATSDTLRATLQSREALAQRVVAERDQARDNLQRRLALAKGGGVSGEELLYARTAVKVADAQVAEAQAAVVAAQTELRTHLALIDGTSVSSHPDTRAAIAHLHDAWIARQRTVIVSPVSGTVARRSVQVGQRVSPGMQLMSVVPLDQLWVEANFKERQLRRMRIGQPVSVTSDLYGSAVVYRGRVAGIDAGTGSAFALLPAQNATGNWLKIVQRVPVRIALDPAQLLAHPLRVGLSMSVRVALQAEAALPSSAGDARRDDYLYTPVFQPDRQAFDALVDRILAENTSP